MIFLPEGCIVVIVATAISHNRPICIVWRLYLPDDDERADEDEGDDNDADDVHRQNNPNDGVRTINQSLINY